MYIVVNVIAKGNKSIHILCHFLQGISLTKSTNLEISPTINLLVAMAMGDKYLPYMYIMSLMHKVPECTAVIAPMNKLCLEMLFDNQIITRGPTTISRMNIICCVLYMASNLTAYLLGNPRMG